MKLQYNAYIYIWTQDKLGSLEVKKKIQKEKKRKENGVHGKGMENDDGTKKKSTSFTSLIQLPWCQTFSDPPPKKKMNKTARHVDTIVVHVEYEPQASWNQWVQTISTPERPLKKNPGNCAQMYAKKQKNNPLFFIYKKDEKA